MKDIKLLYVVLFFLFSNTIVLQAQQQAEFLNEDTYWVDSIMANLSEEERIAQLFMVAAYSNKNEAHKREIVKLVSTYKIGGIMFLQGGPIRQAKLTNYYQSISKVPLMVAIDGEWGVAMRLDSALRFPWQMTLGAIEDTDLIYDMGVEVARQCKLLGIHINFAPVVDVNSNPKNPIINNRSFGENPEKVAKRGIAYMKGMQDNKVLACAKHFPGHGDTDVDSHKTLPVVKHSRKRLDKIELLPFRKLIDEGLGSVMVAHLDIPSLDNTGSKAVSLSPKVVTGLLKKELGFTGLVITDALNMKGVSQFYEPGIVDVEALKAGNDVLLFAQDVPRAIKEIKIAIAAGIITQQEIDLRCKKILISKQWMGLNNYDPINIDKVAKEIIIPQTKVIDRKLIASSLTLLQNYDDLLPLKRLDTLNIASVTIGEDGSSFQHMLSNYAPVKHFTISKDASVSEQAVLLSKLSKFNLVIASVHKSNANAWKSYKIDRKVDILIQSIALQTKVIVPIFANPYSLNSLLFTSNFDALMLAYQNSKLAQELCAQAIFGGVGVSGRIPVTVRHFDINSGLSTKAIRMSYVMPEQANIKTELLYKIDSLVTNAIAQKATPGCQLLIAREGKVFFHKSYGYHTYDKKIKVDNTAVYDLASITKIGATVPILMQMVDAEKLSLDDELGEYLSLDSTDKKQLMIRDILAHQAGLYPWIPFYKQTLVEDSISGTMKLRDTLYDNSFSSAFPHKVADGVYLHYSYSDSIIMQIINSELLDKKEYRYSDLGYYLFKELIEKSYDDKINNIANKEFYAALGMENLGYLPLNRISKDRIVPTEDDFQFRGQLLKGYVHDMGAAMQGGVGGHAGLFSNANDLAKLMQMYLQNGMYGDERYLSEKVIKEFTDCQFCIDENRRGAGFDKPALEEQEGGPTCKCVSYLSFGHTGFTGTLAWADPETEIVYVFLSNRIHPDMDNRKLLEMDVRTNIMEVIFESIND